MNVSLFDDIDIVFLDLDGLLLDTEYLHYQAFLFAGKEFGYNFTFDFLFYLKYISMGRSFLKNILCSFNSNLEQSWESLYQLKENLYISTLKKHPVKFMPGAVQLINKLLELDKEIVIVTNSTQSMVNILIEKCKPLDKVKNWIFRENYKLPKPSPDSYIKAKELYVKEGLKVIGFEDSIKGITALLKSSFNGILVNSLDFVRQQGKKIGVPILSSLEELFI